MDNNQNLNIGKGPGNVGGDNAQKGTGTTVMENKAAKEAELNSLILIRGLLLLLLFSNFLHIVGLT